MGKRELHSRESQHREQLVQRQPEAEAIDPLEPPVAWAHAGRGSGADRDKQLVCRSAGQLSWAYGERGGPSGMREQVEARQESAD